jgi:hypothetical protein
MFKKEINIVCEYQGIFNGQKILKGRYYFTKDERNKKEDTCTYIVAKESIEKLEIGAIYHIEGLLWLDDDCKMNIDIVRLFKNISL